MEMSVQQQQHTTVVIPQQQQLPQSPSGFQGLQNSHRPSHGNFTPPAQPVHHPAALQHQSYQQPLVDDLASYVDHVASARAQSALELHRSTWQEKQQLDALVKQQSARLQQQAAELEVLRGLARQQQPAQTVQQQLQLQQQGAGFSSTQDSPLQRLMDLHKQEVAEWYRQCTAEKQGRLAAEAALRSTLVIVEELEAEAGGISSMLKDVVAVEAAAAAAAKAEAEAATRKGRWRPALALQTTCLGLTLQMAAAVFVAGCGGVASAFITLAIKGC